MFNERDKVGWARIFQAAWHVDASLVVQSAYPKSLNIMRMQFPDS